MIDVPARVKDALKSGDHRKNVKITVPNVVLGYDIVRTDEPISTQQTYTEVWESMEIVGWEIEAGANFFVSQKTDKLRIIANHTFTYWAITYNDTVISQGAPDEAGGTVITTDCPDVPSEVPASAYHLILYIKTNSYQDKPSLLPVVFEYLEENHVIDNNNLVAESVKFDERMCSDTELKFGLCEGTSVEFQYFDLPNIRGEHISISIDVQYKDTDGTLAWHEIPMGQYDVDECSRQASTGIIKATAYNKLKSEFLDDNAISLVTQIVAQRPDGVSVSEILEELLDEYSINNSTYQKIEVGQYKIHPFDASFAPNRRIYLTNNTPYEPPSPVVDGKPYNRFFGVYYGEISIIPEGETGDTTSNYYKYVIDFPAIWRALNNGKWYDPLNRLVQFSPGFIDIFDNTEYCVRTISDPDHAYLPKDATAVAGNIYLENQGTLYIQPNKNSIVTTGDVTDGFPVISFVIAIECDIEAGQTTPPAYGEHFFPQQFERVTNDIINSNFIQIYRKNLTPIDLTRITLEDLKSSVTLRDLQSAVFETNCQYGKLDRVSDLFSGIELNNGALYPRDDLYPADTLLPMGTAEAGYPAMYSKLWADEGNVRTFRNLIITYKGTETVEGQTQEVEKKLQRTVNANGTDDYNMSDNWLFKNLVWSDADVATYADAMVAKMQNMSWFPFELWCAGLPYLEAGDAIEIAMQQGTYKSYVLRRNLNGIQNLQDEMINGTLDIF